MRHLLAFLLLGTVLFVGKRSLEIADAARPELLVRVRPSATPQEVEAAIDEAVLIERALLSKSTRVDPIVRDLLLRSMRLERVDADDEKALLTRAFRLGVHRTDPVVRQRLIFQARQVLRADLPRETPSDSELKAYFLSHSERYREPPRISFRQVFLSRARHGKALAAATQALARHLREIEGAASDLALPSDPTLLPSSMERVSERDIDARFGPDFASGVFAAADGKYVGPLVSSYGVHFVFVHRRLPATLLSLSTLRQRVTLDFWHDAEESALHNALRALRAGYLIRIQHGAA